MKKTLLALVVLFTANATHAAQNYAVGNAILGIGIGAGSASVYPLGPPMLSIQPSAEVILGAWNKNIGIAMGFTLDSSLNFLGNGFTGTLAPMATLHLTLLPKFDWYVSLGLGIQFVPDGTRGYYSFHAGFATGFNIVVHKNILWNIGLAIHADQFFGTTGLKFRFGDVKNIKL